MTTYTKEPTDPMIATGVAVGVNLARGNWGGTGVAAVGFIPGAKLAGKIVSDSGRIAKLGKQFVGLQAKSKYIGVYSRLGNIKIGRMRLGWSKGVSQTKPKAPANWRMGWQVGRKANASNKANQKRDHFHLFDHASNVNYSRGR